MSHEPPHAPVCVAERYQLGRMIGSGSFGEVFIAKDKKTKEEVAVKLEPTRARVPQLAFEAKVYQLLHGGAGIPNVRLAGREGDYNVLVLDLLGPNLEDLLSFCGRKFSLKTVCLLAEQMISRIEWMHSKSLIHRDIKPDNFLMGLGKNSTTVCCVDFGLAKKYRDARTHQHIPYRENRALTGTARYCSINTHKCISQSRRDDMEALGYVFVYMAKGSLPWQGIKANTKTQKYERIMERKVSTNLHTLCQDLPPQFAAFMTSARELKFEEKPDYAYLRGLFNTIMLSIDAERDNVYDWVIVKQSMRRKSVSGPAAAAQHQDSATADRRKSVDAVTHATAGTHAATASHMPTEGKHVDFSPENSTNRSPGKVDSSPVNCRRERRRSVAVPNPAQEPPRESQKIQRQSSMTNVGRGSNEGFALPAIVK
eukprot:GFYU01003167.1.p1 GENE.GFYU01003167.1~~GFYU01003167.1.p1  ORF type:complete len:426 (-),score=79.15 GFYU01003167.1:129-1406(-)